MDGWFECEQLDSFFERVLKAHIDEFMYRNRRLLLRFLTCRYVNLQTRSRAFQVGQKHYDLGNGLFEQMLDSTMSYSCGYWKEAETLEQAQVNKLDSYAENCNYSPV